MADSSNFLQKTLYVITTVPCVPLEEMRKHLPAHIDRQVELEKAGIMFGAGPVFNEGSEVPDAGMIIVRADSFDHAREIADGDDLTARDHGQDALLARGAQGGTVAPAGRFVFLLAHVVHVRPKAWLKGPKFRSSVWPGIQGTSRRLP